MDKITIADLAIKTTDVVKAAELVDRAFKDINASVEEQKLKFNSLRSQTKSVIVNFADIATEAANAEDKLSALAKQFDYVSKSVGKVATNTHSYVDAIKGVSKADLAGVAKKLAEEEAVTQQKLAEASKAAEARRAASIKKNTQLNRQAYAEARALIKKEENDKAKLERAKVLAHRKAIDAMVRKNEQLKKSNEDLILSMRGFVRVLTVQVIRRAFNELLTATRRAIDIQTEFERKITEIRTISQKNQGTIEEWSKSLYKLSNAWGLDIIDVAEARYQILSNQIASGVAETDKFAETSSKFARIVKSDLASSVNLLTAILNSYGKSAAEADDISAKFFKTIELGRFRAEDLASTIGVASVPAQQMGVEFEELMAMIAHVTKQGVTASTSLTLIRNIVLKLAKPTDELKELFKEWGVETGEQAIAAYGLYGVLQKVEEATRNSASEVAQLFGRIRASTGVSSLINNFEEFRDVLAEIETQSGDAFANAEKMLFETSGDRVAKALNEVKNYFSETFGANVLVSIDKLSSALGDDKEGGLVKIVKTLVAAFTDLLILEGLVWGTKGLAAIYKFTLAVIAENKAVRYLSASYHQLSTIQKDAYKSTQLLFSAGAYAALFLIVEAVRRIVDAAIEEKRALEESSKSIREWERTSTNAAKSTITSFDAAIKAYKDATQGLNAAYAGANSVLYKSVQEINNRIAESNKFITDNQEGILNSGKDIIDSYKESYKILTSLANEYKDAVEDAKREQSDLQRQQKDYLLSVQKRFATDQQIEKLLTERIKKEEKEYKTLAVGSDDYIKKANELIDLNKELVDVRSEIAKSLAGDRKLTNIPSDVETAMESALQKMRELEVVQINRQIELEKYGKTIKITLDNISTDYDKILGKVNDMLKLLNQATVGAGKLGEDTLEEAYRKALATDGKITVGADASLGNAIKDIDEFIRIFESIKPDLDTIAAITDLNKKIKENTAQLVAQQKYYEDQIKTIKDATAETKTNIDAQSKTVGQDFASLADGFVKGVQIRTEQALKTAPLQDTRISTEEIKNIIADLQGEALNVPERAALVKLLPSLLERYQALIKESNIQGESDVKLLDLTKQMIQESNDILKLYAEYKQSVDQIPVLQGYLNEATNLLQGQLRTVEAHGRILEENIGNSYDVGDLIESFKGDLILLREAIRGQAVGAGFTPDDFKPVFKDGGVVRGADTVPAILNPGEFIMNQRATQRFYSELIAMNSGARSTGYGSNTYSNTYGDINVNVTGGIGRGVTPNDIVMGIRRGISRGTLRL